MAALTDLYNYVLPDIQGIDIALFNQEAMLAAEEFFRLAKIWTKTQTTDIVASDGTYALDGNDSDTIITDIESVVYNGKYPPLEPSSEQDLELAYTDWTTEAGTPRYFFADQDMTTLTVVPKPQAAITSGLVITLIQAPDPEAAADASGSLPDWYVRRHRDTLVEGIKYRLRQMKDKPWSSMERADYHRKRFNAGVSRARMRHDQGFSRSRLRSRAVYR